MKLFSVTNQSRVSGDYYEVQIESNLEMICDSYKNWVIWLFESKLPEGGFNTYNLKKEEVSRDTTLYIPSVTYKNNGNYYCFGQYAKKNKYFIARVEVKIYGNYI